ncbi:MAG: alpha/beta fold hydrolase [Pseudomonadota bacterium]|jgi:pimeloyl-ACP methyl ester carboxylesterase
MDRDPSSSGKLHLRAVGSFHVGGQRQTLQGLPVEQIRLAVGAPARSVDPNGSYISGQMYVQYFLQQNPVCPWPLVLWHGGGMTGANWESTPDGRPGWLQRLLESGWDVYVCDAVERGRAGWSRWPEIYQQAPLFRTLEEGWDMFRIGPPLDGINDGLSAHPGQQFPVDAFEAFAAQWVPRWADHEAITLQAYQALLQKIGPCAVVAHSQGGGLALSLAARCPALFKAVVAIEPSGAPDQLPPAGTCPPCLMVWGDHVAGHPIWRTYRERVDQHAQALKRQGAQVTQLDLPAQGIQGNSHFPMLDRNSDQVLEQILHWLHPLIS